MTITHDVEHEEVMAYLDGELPASRALAVRAHLDQCAECRALSDELRDVSGGLAEWTIEPAPERLAVPAAIGPSGDRAIGRLKSLSDRLVSSRFRWSLVGATVLGLALVAATWEVVGRRTTGVGVGPANGTIAPAPARPAAGRGGDANRALGYASGPSSDAKKAPTGGIVGGSASGQQGQQIGLSVYGTSTNPKWNLEGGSITDLSSNSSPAQAATNNQMIVRTATIALSTEKFEDMRAALERVAAAHQGSVAALTLVGDPPNRRSLRATLRVPIAELDTALAGVRALGTVLQESQSSEDITDAHRDLAIRIANAKIEETRLGEILKDRTGRLSDVLAVEQAQSRVRTEIEQMEAQEIAMRNRAALSTISVEVDERYRAELAETGPLPMSVRLRNAVVDGARTALESLVGFALAFLGAAPTLMIWAAILFLPARWAIRRVRRALATS